jgi:hypothetical protein
MFVYLLSTVLSGWKGRERPWIAVFADCNSESEEKTWNREQLHEFLDTNVLVDAYDASNPIKQGIAQRLVRRAVAGEIVASTQVLAEFDTTLLHQLSPARSTQSKAERGTWPRVTRPDLRPVIGSSSGSNGRARAGG